MSKKPSKFDLAYQKRLAICRWLAEHPGKTATEITAAVITPVFGTGNVCTILKTLTGMFDRGELRRERHNKLRSNGRPTQVYRYWAETLTPRTAQDVKVNMYLNVRPDDKRFTKHKPDGPERAERIPLSGEIAPGHYRQYAGSAKVPNHGGQGAVRAKVTINCGGNWK
jgi:hypothetical protein